MGAVRLGFGLCVLCVLDGWILGLSVLAQAQNYSGTWKLNREASQITKGTGLTGLGAGGAPPTLYISQAANGTIVIGSDINESHARTFKATATALAHEAGGVKESLSMSADGQTLTVKVTAPAGGSSGSPESEVTSTIVYTKVLREDPCEKWPTPCRYDSRR